MEPEIEIEGAPKGGDAETRIQELIRSRNQARSDAQDARAELAEATEALTTAKAATDAAVAAAKGEAAAKITDLEGQVRRASNRELLLADKIPLDQIDEVLEYLDFAWSKAKPAEGQTERPDFATFYGEARKTNKYLRGAMKPSVREAAAGAAAGDEADPAKAALVVPPVAEVKPPKTPAVIPPKGNVIPPKAGDTGAGLPDMSKIKIGTPEYAAAKEKARKLAFAGR